MSKSKKDDTDRLSAKDVCNLMLDVIQKYTRSIAQGETPSWVNALEAVKNAMPTIIITDYELECLPGYLFQRIASSTIEGDKSPIQSYKPSVPSYVKSPIQTYKPSVSSHVNSHPIVIPAPILKKRKMKASIIKRDKTK